MNEKKRETRQLSVIKKPAEGTRTVIAPDEMFLIGTGGEGTVDFVCGGCRYVLCEGIDAGMVRNMVILCPECGVYNETLL